jgi:hypothetical protein
VGEFGFLMPEKQPEAHRLTLGGSLVQAAFSQGTMLKILNPQDAPKAGREGQRGTQNKLNN